MRPEDSYTDRAKQTSVGAQDIITSRAKDLLLACLGPSTKVSVWGSLLEVGKQVNKSIGCKRGRDLDVAVIRSRGVGQVHIEVPKENGGVAMGCKAVECRCEVGQVFKGARGKVGADQRVSFVSNHNMATEYVGSMPLDRFNTP